MNILITGGAGFSGPRRSGASIPSRPGRIAGLFGAGAGFYREVAACENPALNAALNAALALME